MNIDYAINEYKKYCKTYDISEPHMMSTFHHTYRVVENIKDIAKSENLGEDDVRLACLCALVHDIGRYKQYATYKTFEDARSFDHANEACNILLKGNFISKFTTNKDEQQIILKATKNHNKYKIEDGLSERELLFAKMLRDADKLDIMKTKGNTIKDTIILNPKYLKPFQEKRLYKNNGVTGEYEVTLRTLAFVYDMHFKHTYEMILESNIIHEKIHLIMSHSNSIGILEYLEKNITNYVKERIEELSK